MDVVWLKRDVRIHDHGPFAAVSNNPNPVLIIHLFEPDQLAEPTVHGSHVCFTHEGLLDLEYNLSGNTTTPMNSTTAKASGADHNFRYLTVCYNTAIETLETFHTSPDYPPINRLFAHEETGHWQSYMRDRVVRKWCRNNRVPFIEFVQTGVTRCLKDRDDFSKKLQTFLARPMHATPNLEKLRSKIIQVNGKLPSGIRLCPRIMDLGRFQEIPSQHRVDRSKRSQRGGEQLANEALQSFLMYRGVGFSSGISSPNSSWTTCSRLSPYLTWGHISIRTVVCALRARQDELKRKKTSGEAIDGRWLRSLSAFSARVHWRSHFIQKLESEPLLEKKDLCPAYQELRRQDGDWNEEYYNAWATGTTGFPFVDACMRCLISHGWINFRMRAMLVSFATYNLWLDWKRLAPHLARVFLDYEPGIHYPQLQMQSGTTGINAMRVYSVTKQGKDQDPDGEFIRRHVSALTNVPPQHIHEPWKMSKSLQKECNLQICQRSQGNDVNLSTGTSRSTQLYPAPIVNEQASAKAAKDKVAGIRNLGSTKQQAQKVYQKHGSRNPWRESMNGKKPKGPPRSSAAAGRKDEGSPSKQPKISTMFAQQQAKAQSSVATMTAAPKNKNRALPSTHNNDDDVADSTSSMIASIPAAKRPKAEHINMATTSSTAKSTTNWSCTACTFLNEKPMALACSICATPRTKLV